MYHRVPMFPVREDTMGRNTERKRVYMESEKTLVPETMTPREIDTRLAERYSVPMAD